MSYSYSNNIELEEALKIYTAEILKSGVRLGDEKIPVKDSFRRVTSEAVYAHISSPHYNACAMDGIAVCAASTFGATDTTPVILKEWDKFIRVDTGDPLPDGFDAIVMIEDVIELYNGTIKLISSTSPWQHIRQIGEDLCANEMILTANTRIEPAAIGALLAGGVSDLRVWKKPMVGLIPTGDEIVTPTCNPGKGEIIEFNSSIFSAMIEGWGAAAKVYCIIPDEFSLIRDAVNRASEECDIVILNAGSSAGRDDYSARAISEIGNVIIHGISIRPGKPAILGMVNGRPAVGVPGYPISGIIVMEKMVKPVIELLMHSNCGEGMKAKAVLSRKLVSSLKYKEFIRMKLGHVGERIVATPLNRGAGVVTSFVKADGLMEIPMNSEGFEAGREIEVQLLRPEEQIRNTIVIIGSHDPLIDEAANILHSQYPLEYISSAHVGSMGGVMAVKRGEAHIAGIHLLDELTGEYNVSYIKNYLANENIMLIRGVTRIQGFMTAPGNSKNIKDIKDISKDGIRYVNRQRGSGTRILLDYLLKKYGISPSGIYGYEREDFTHLSVAAAVASCSADTGMGIFSAARAYGLDFIPVCEEQYDFIVPAGFLEHKIIKHFIKVLKSEEFRNALEILGGYKIADTGSIYEVKS